MDNEVDAILGLGPKTANGKQDEKLNKAALAREEKHMHDQIAAIDGASRGHASGRGFKAKLDSAREHAHAVNKVEEIQKQLVAAHKVRACSVGRRVVSMWFGQRLAVLCAERRGSPCGLLAARPQKPGAWRRVEVDPISLPRLAPGRPHLLASPGAGSTPSPCLASSALDRQPV